MDLFNLQAFKGLLDEEELNRAQGQGITNLGLALLQNSTAMGYKPRLGQIIGQSYGAGQQGANESLRTLFTAKELKQKQDEMRKKQEQEQYLMGIESELLGSMKGTSPVNALGADAGRVGPTPERAELLGKTQGMSNKEKAQLYFDAGMKLSVRFPERAKQYFEIAEKLNPNQKFEKLGKGEQLIDPSTGKIIAQGMDDLPTAVREYQYAQSQGYKGSFNDFQTQLKRAGATNVSVGGKGDNAFAIEGAKIFAKDFGEIAAQGRQASRTLGQINQLDSLLSKTGGGAGAQLKSFAGGFGIDVEGLDDVQAAVAIINQLVPQQRPPGSGTMSDADLALFKQSLPRLINQPGGNKKIIQTMRGIAEYDRQMGKIASDALTGRISREEADRKMIELPNPLAGFSNQGVDDPLGLR